MSKSLLQHSRFLVLVDAEREVSQTIEYALREARDHYAEFEQPVILDICIINHDGVIDDRTRAIIHKTISAFEGDNALQTSIETVVLAGDSPEDQTEGLLNHINHRELSRLIIEADTDLSVERLRESVGVTTVELTARTTPYERPRLLHSGGVRRLGTIFGLTYLFYLAIGGFAGGLDLMTGAISASVVALSLSHVALREEPALERTGLRVIRMVAFVPILLWEIVKANFVIAYIILHPTLPIDPSMEVVETDTRYGLERMILANSITLTPGTVTVDVHEKSFTIHSLTAGTRTALQEGRLASLVAWVFHGRERANEGTSEDG